MTEEKKENNKEEIQEQGTPKNSNEGIHEETISELDRADQIAERQKRENDRREKLLEREEALAARKAVGGITNAGEKQEEKEETPEEYANKVMKNKK